MPLNMNENANEDFIPCKKFKSLHEGHEIWSDDLKEGEAGNYFLGSVIKDYITAPVTQCLARKKGTDNYYLMKILILDDSDSADKCSFMRRTVFHNEYSFLSLLKNHPGVIQLCDFFKDYIYKENSDKLKRICMVLECLIPHGHHNPELIPLNHYLKEGRLTEIEALYTFYNLLLILEDLHNKNIVHRDLKFSNVILNRKTLKVKLMDFYCAELITSSNKIKYNQCKLSSYSSPDLLDGEGVFLKKCDMCSAGVILYGMLNGSVVKNDFSLSNNTCISDGTKELLRKIQFKLETSEAVDMVSTLLAIQCTSQNPSLFVESKNSDQIVPECPDFDSTDQNESAPVSKKKSFPVVSEISRESEREVGSPKEKIRRRVSDADPERHSSTPANPKLSLQNGLLIRKEIKYAMLRLGVTSVNSINALSFNYCKKNSCRS